MCADALNGLLGQHAGVIGYCATWGDRSRITNQSGYCVSLATVFPDPTQYTAGPPFDQRRCGGSRASVSRGVIEDTGPGCLAARRCGHCKI